MSNITTLETLETKLAGTVGVTGMAPDKGMLRVNFDRANASALVSALNTLVQHGLATVELGTDGKVKVSQYDGKTFVRLIPIVKTTDGGLELSERSTGSKADSKPKRLDRDQARFIQVCLKHAMELAPKSLEAQEALLGNGKNRIAIYPYKAIQEAGQSFKDCQGQNWDYGICLNFNADKLGLKDYGNLREFMEAAVRYSNGNNERSNRKDSRVAWQDADGSWYIPTVDAHGIVTQIPISAPDDNDTEGNEDETSE